MSKVLAISEVLYNEDPAFTCCAENDCFDEYDGVAEIIVKNPEASINNILFEIMGRGGLSADAEEKIKGILNEV